MKRIIIACLAGIFCSGCASTTVFEGAVRTSPTTKEPATIRIQRANNILGAAIPYLIYDNARRVGALGPGGTIEWKRDPGYMSLDAQMVGPQRNALFRPAHPIPDNEPNSHVKRGAIREIVGEGDIRLFHCATDINGGWVTITALNPVPTDASVTKAEAFYLANLKAKATGVVNQWAAISAGASTNSLPSIMTGHDRQDFKEYSIISKKIGKMADGGYREELVIICYSGSQIDVFAKAGMIRPSEVNLGYLRLMVQVGPDGKIADWHPKISANTATMSQINQ